MHKIKKLPSELNDFPQGLKTLFERKGYSLEKIKKMRKGELCSICGCQPPRSGLKTCIKCANKSKNKWENKSTIAKAEIIEQKRKYRSNNIAKYKRIARKSKLRKVYGISLEEFDRLEKSQSGVCAICFRPPRNGKNPSRLTIDHNHQSGKIRGLLCNNCNVAIGAMADSMDRLYSAISYLEKHKTEIVGE